MQVVLVMFRNDGERRSFSVVRNMTVIGRREDCDLRIPVGDVSRKHCRLVRTDDGIRIEDLGSSNGTYVNGVRIQESELGAGDTVGVGPVQFIVQIDGEPDEEDMEAPVAVIPEPIAGAEPHEEILTEEAELEELPADEEFQIEEEEHAPAAEVPHEEEPLGELEELPVQAQAPVEEEAAEVETSLEEEPTEVAAAPAEEDDLEFDLEEEPAAEKAEPAPAAPPAAEPLHELDELELEESPAAPTVAAKPHTDLELDELELEEDHAAAPAAHAIAEPANSLDELDFEDTDLELDAPAPAPPAYGKVDIDSTEEPLDELELEEEPHAADGKPAEKESDSAWDFVIEETESSRSHSDFKLDDSRHEQPHG